MTSIFDENDSEIVAQIEKWYSHAKKAHRDWRDHAKEDYQFYSGQQWSAEDERYLRESKRPIVTFNRVAPTIDAVTGSERNNRQEVRYLPRTMDDGELNEMLTATARWIRDQCDAEDEESEAFFDTLVCGMGWTETWLDFDDDLDGRIRIERVPPLEMFWDPDSNKRNLSDARWVMRLKEMERAEVEDLWPDKELNLTGGFDSPDIVSNDETQEEARFYRGEDSSSDTDNDTLTVVQVQWWERRPVMRAINPETGQLQAFTLEDFQNMQDRFPEIRGVRQSRREFFQAFAVGKTLLQKNELHTSEDSRPIPDFTLRSVTGKRNYEDREWFGLMRAMKDPQRWSNKFFSQIQDILNSNAKGGLIAEKGVFDSTQDAEDSWAHPDKIVWVNDGALTEKRVTERSQSGYPAGFDRMMQVAMGAVRDTSGVSVELLGTPERTQSGVVEQSRIRQGMITLAVFFDSLRRYRKEQGRVLLHFINLYIPDGEMVRVVGEDRFVQFTRDGSAKKYDIIVDQAPTSPNYKQEVWASLQNVLPAMMRAGMPVPPDVIDFLPLPQSVITRMKKFMAEASQPSPEQQEMQKIALDQAKADVRKTVTEAIENMAQAQSNIDGRENDRNQTQIDAMRAIVEAVEKLGTEEAAEVAGSES